MLLSSLDLPIWSRLQIFAGTWSIIGPMAAVAPEECAASITLSSQNQFALLLPGPPRTVVPHA